MNAIQAHERFSKSGLQNSPVISLRAISKSYSGYKALHDISVDIPQGVTGLLGPNGAGKSTLIKILLGLLRATSGSGTLLELPIGRTNTRIRELVGYMPEDDCYLPSLSGVECVQFAARLNCIPAIEALRRSHEILDFCGAGQERYRTVETYSTGMRQKLKFAQALVHDPPLLILDEPTSGLDPDERDAMLNRIRSLADNHGKSVVICTHILPDVQHVSDFVVILAAGRVSVAKTLAELSRPQSPSLMVRTLGSPAKLAECLIGEGIDVSVGALGGVIVADDSAQCIRKIWDIAVTNQIVIRSLTPAKNSMETIFLEAVQNATQGANHADS